MSTPHVVAGTLIRYRLSLHGIPFGWTTQIRGWRPPYRFTDTQLSGPFSLWHHTHLFRPQDGGTMISDIVRYRVPFGILGRVLQRAKVRTDVEHIFQYRRESLTRMFASKAG
jgi:ligand-binding SRPBCC domain-containing protein